MSGKKKDAPVVVLGGGFGGLFTAYHLTAGAGRDRLPVMMISRDEDFVFKPLLPEAVGGTCLPHFLTNHLPQLAESWRFNFVQDSVTGIDLDAQRVHTSGGEFAYRDLVIALGSVVDDRGVDLNGSRVFRMHELDDGPRLRAHVKRQVQKAVRAKTAATRRKALSFVSVGAGPTGIETLTEIQEYVRICLKESHAPHLAEETSYTVIEGGPDILPTMRPRVRDEVRTLLKRRGITIEATRPVIEVAKGRCTLSDGTVLQAGTIVWTAGIRANPLMGDIRGPVDKQGRVRVDTYLRPRGQTNVFALGDNACAVHPKTRAPLPATGQVAVQQAKTVATNIRRRHARRPLQPFKYTELGQLVPLAGGEAAGYVLGRKVEGRSAWFVSRAAYFGRVLGVDNQIGLAWGWGRQAMAQSLLRPLWR